MTTRTTLHLVLAVALSAAPAGAQQPDTARTLTLGDAARLAAQQSNATLAARARAEQAEARADQRRADLLPMLGAAASRGDHTTNTATFGFAFPGLDPDGSIIGPVKVIDLRLRASQSLLDLGALERWRSSQSAAKASDLDADAVAEQAGASAAAAYLRAVRAEANLRARAADSALAAELLGIARDQLRAGVGVGLDVTRAEAQVSGTHAALIGARSDRDRARLELLRTLGLPLDTRLVLRDTLGEGSAPVEAPDEAAAVERALRARPDLRAADAQLEATKRSVRAVRAERLPTVGLFGDQGAIGKDTDHLLNTYNWGVAVNLPLFDGFRREERVEEQRAVVKEVEARRRDLRQLAAVEVRSALLDLGSAREQLDAARERLRLGEQELSQARERFRAGVSGNADVITASLSLNAARTSVIDALTLYQAARVAYARAQGAVRELP